LSWASSKWPTRCSNQQVVTKLTREGSNLISRDTSLQDAATAMASLSTRPVNLATARD
jgi:hypothetical protein